ncbi:hypothetical protein Trydic_g8392 [Trypoxylus dichotomus]
MVLSHIAEKCFPEKIYQYSTPISTCAGTKTSQYKNNISLFEELNILDAFEFILFPFHDCFDGILGLRGFKRLDLTIDTKSQTPRGNSLEIPFFYRRDFETQKIEIPPGSSVIKNIHTLYPEYTETIISDIINDNDSLRFLSCITEFKSATVPLEIQNPTDQTQLVELKPNFVSKFGNIFNPNDYECYHVEDTVTSNCTQLNHTVFFQNLRTNDLNPEGKYHLENVIREFSDIFRNESSHLTFTNKVKSKHLTMSIKQKCETK